MSMLHHRLANTTQSSCKFTISFQPGSKKCNEGKHLGRKVKFRILLPFGLSNYPITADPPTKLPATMTHCNIPTSKQPTQQAFHHALTSDSSSKLVVINSTPSEVSHAFRSAHQSSYLNSQVGAISLSLSLSLFFCTAFELRSGVSTCCL